MGMTQDSANHIPLSQMLSYFDWRQGQTLGFKRPVQQVHMMPSRSSHPPFTVYVLAVMDALARFLYEVLPKSEY